MEHTAEKVWRELIWQDKDRMSGAPCIYGTRIRVEDLFNWISNGHSIDEFLETYPNVPREKVLEILRLAEVELLKDFDAA